MRTFSSNSLGHESNDDSYLIDRKNSNFIINEDDEKIGPKSLEVEAFLLKTRFKNPYESINDIEENKCLLYNFDKSFMGKKNKKEVKQNSK
jgi:hypothetical protein